MARKYPPRVDQALLALIGSQPRVTAPEAQALLAEDAIGVGEPVVMPTRTAQLRLKRAREIQKRHRPALRPDQKTDEAAESVRRHFLEGALRVAQGLEQIWSERPPKPGEASAYATLGRLAHDLTVRKPASGRQKAKDVKAKRARERGRITATTPATLIDKLNRADKRIASIRKGSTHASPIRDNGPDNARGGRQDNDDGR